jgi:hypothetical protein
MVNFVLNAFNREVTLVTAAQIPAYTPTITTDATITLTTSVSAALLQSVFFFRADTDITVDASFVYYYVNKTPWSNLSTVINPSNGTVTSNFYVANDNVSKDFIRDLARQLFGTYLGADMFTNEDAVVSDINAKCAAVATEIDTLIGSIDITTGSLAGMSTDGAGKKYFKDDLSTSNISREMFNILMTAAPGRFVDISGNYNYNSVQDGYYKMPIITGDTISFKLTINPAADQRTKVPTGTSVINQRTYTVVLNVS